MGVTAGHDARRRGRIVIGENDPSLVRYAGLAVTGELARRLRLVELIDAELAVERRARPVKVRRRGLSPGQLVVSLAESQLVGGEFFSDLEEVRADEAGDGLRAVGRTPSAPTALQRAKDFRRVHCRRVERACARVGDHLDRALGREPRGAGEDRSGRHPGAGVRPPQAGRGAQPPGRDELRAAGCVLGPARPGADIGAGGR